MKRGGDCPVFGKGVARAPEVAGKNVGVLARGDEADDEDGNHQIGNQAVELIAGHDATARGVRSSDPVSLMWRVIRAHA